MLRVADAADDVLAWTLAREDGAWRIGRGAAERPTALVEGKADPLWRLLYDALSPEETRGAFVVHGPADLVAPLWRARSVMV